MAKDDRDAKRVAAVIDIVDRSREATMPVRETWCSNYEMFERGTVFKDKQDWQSAFSINKIGSGIRHVQGELMGIIINNPDWYDLEVKSLLNNRAQDLREPLKKLLDHHLDKAKYKKVAGTFILCSLISMGSCVVGWKDELIQNPRYLVKKTKRDRQREQAAKAKLVENTRSEGDSNNQDALLESFNKAIGELQSEMSGAPAPVDEIKEKPYLQVGRLDFQLPNHESIFWDPNVTFMEESRIGAYTTTMNLWEVRQLRKLGFFNSNVDKLDGSTPSDKILMQKLRYTGIRKATREDKVELLTYFGPLIVNGRIEKERYFAVIANNSVLIKEGEYPYWEPPGHYTPIVNCAVRQLPYKSTGAGIGETAVPMQRTLDSNWTLVCDQMRLGVAGILVVDYSNVVDKSVTEEGIEPGKPIVVRGNPKEVIQHIQLTSNIENQVMPIQEALRQGIQEVMGVNDISMGAANLRSRTTAAETKAMVSGATANTNSVALELEQNFIIPTLEKCFARILQFGIPDLASNPEAQAILTDEELQLLLSINAEESLDIINQFYKFTVRGFSSKNENMDLLSRLNEVMTIMNSGGPMSMAVDPEGLFRQWLKAARLEDKGLLLKDDHPYMKILAENKVLASGTMVEPNQQDDHEMHLKFQMPLAQSPMATPAQKQHAQIHMQALQQIQMAQQQSQQLQQGGGHPHQPPPPPITH